MSERRRLLGPANTFIPNIGITSTTEEAVKTRKRDEIRKFFLKTGLIENANGSAYLEADGTIVQVLVFGPRPIRGSFIERASFSVECKFLPHIAQPNEGIFNTGSNNNNGNYRTGLTNIEQKISSYIETSLLPSIILEKYPKSTIDVFITVISSDSIEDHGGKTTNSGLLNLVNWVLNCSSVALADSGIELKDIVSSGVVRLDKEGIVLDPQETGGEGIDGLVSFMNLRNDEIVGFWMEGDEDLEEKDVERIIDGCNTMSKKIRANINSYLLEQAS
ncbi:exosome exoribonuclease [Suhomyces tanzawaensis NRRL Y-17324]|uniref:Exosome exoribonuclease n=1 Tax=Suhomyces tanzawaensis NRRL Y-17324 TaxID=984487 RepID=A0A1E4SJ03_9ASCO|nr:exosome exoribonuclease [Suhomyces tanzawaensis NRRL Y-17324]ODV79412.1 exosome exoribonuclease [Suhomyces tanzawaensis NRRL Y-17324]